MCSRLRPCLLPGAGAARLCSRRRADQYNQYNHVAPALEAQTILSKGASARAASKWPRVAAGTRGGLRLQGLLQPPPYVTSLAADAKHCVDGQGSSKHKAGTWPCYQGRERGSTRKG